MASALCARCKRSIPEGMGSCLWCGTVAGNKAEGPSEPAARATVAAPANRGVVPAHAGTPVRKPERMLCPHCMAPVAPEEIVTYEGERMCQSCSIHRARVVQRGTAKAKPAQGAAQDPAWEPRSLANACPVHQHGECMKAKVKVTVPSIVASMNPDSQGFEGKADLDVSERGLRITMTGLFTNKQTVAIEWDRIREMKNELRTKRRFDADFGGRLLRVKMQPGDAMRLANLFGRLPTEVYGERCPWCGGVSLNGTCRSCKRSPGSFHRISGIWIFGTGVVTAGVGVALSAMSYAATQPGEEYHIYTGIMGIGFVSIVGGIFQILLGKNART